MAEYTLFRVVGTFVEAMLLWRFSTALDNTSQTRHTPRPPHPASSPEMHSSRRTFLKQCGLATASTSLLASWQGFAAPSAWVRRDMPLSEVDNAVLNFVGSYGYDIRIAGGSVLARRRGKSGPPTRILVRIRSPHNLSSVWNSAGLPVDGIYAAGNTLSFSQDGSDYQVENLLPDVAETNLTQLRKGRGFAFAHDALQYRSDDGKISDPLNAQGTGALKLNRAGKDLAEAFDNVLRGWIEAEQLDLRLNEAFLRLQKRVLHAAAKRPALAQSVVRSLVQRLATLADTLPPSKLQTLFHSRVVRTALQAALGLDSEILAQKFENARVTLPADFADSAVWLAIFFETELTEGSVGSEGWLESSDRFQTHRSRAALSHARDAHQLLFA